MTYRCNEVDDDRELIRPRMHVSKYNLIMVSAISPPNAMVDTVCP